MKQVIHFKTQAERLAYLKGELKEVVPKKAKDEKAEEKPKKKKSKKEDK